jgi:hypothetical protein
MDGARHRAHVLDLAHREAPERTRPGAEAGSYHPHRLPLFCSESHFESGAK